MTHADHVVNQVTKKVAEAIQGSPKAKGLSIKPAPVKKRLSFIIVATLDNPTFSSQTKNTCTLRLLSSIRRTMKPQPSAPSFL